VNEKANLSGGERATAPCGRPVATSGARPIAGIGERVRAAADWLCRSQDKSACDGSAAYYAPLIGWSAAYPETTGYIIPTLWRCADVLGYAGYAVRAERMLRWLLDLQSDEGWFPGGKWRAGRLSEPSVFNTAQIVFGLVEGAARTDDGVCKAAAERAVEWLVGTQGDDGRWVEGHYREGYQPSYYAHVCWPMAEYWRAFGGDGVRQAIQRALDVVVSARNRQGTFSGWGFRPGRPAFTHTIAYTLQGLLESALILDAWQPYGHVALRSSEKLMRKYEIQRRLAGAYDERWRGSFWYACLTGHCQLASTWLHLYRRDGDPRFLNAAVRALGEVSARQRIAGSRDNVRGAIAGSWPLYGRYMMFRYPNWAAKFFIDAMLDLQEELGRLSPPADVWTGT
jgi:hypothetical protein